MGRDESQVLMGYHPKANSTRYCCSLCDVRRFDVEGACNIRYKIRKKRIDKVHISTGERLTQPGKIALVYSNQKEAQEYTKFIEYLQDQQILNDDFEYL